MNASPEKWSTNSNAMLSTPDKKPLTLTAVSVGISAKSGINTVFSGYDSAKSLKSVIFSPVKLGFSKFNF